MPVCKDGGVVALEKTFDKWMDATAVEALLGLTASTEHVVICEAGGASIDLPETCCKPRSKTVVAGWGACTFKLGSVLGRCELS